LFGLPPTVATHRDHRTFVPEVDCGASVRTLVANASDCDYEADHHDSLHLWVDWVHLSLLLPRLSPPRPSCYFHGYRHRSCRFRVVTATTAIVVLIITAIVRSI
jgi:hypothetical protein